MNFFKIIEAEVELLLGKVPKEVNEYADQALEITTGIKNFLSNPLVDLAVSLIPGAWAETVKNDVLAAVNKALPFITIIDNCKDQTDTLKLVACWAEQLKTLPQGTVDGTLQQLAMYIAYFLDGQQLTKSEYALVVQLKYTSANS